MSAKKLLLITLAFLVAILSLSFLGLRSFTQRIAENRSCEWANIDHIELHTHINIPKVREVVSCDYDERLKSKTAVFRLDPSDYNANRYLEVNGFRKWLDASGQPPKDLDGYFDENAYLHQDDLYFLARKSARQDFVILLDKQTSTLSVYLHYAN